MVGFFADIFADFFAALADLLVLAVAYLEAFLVIFFLPFFDFFALTGAVLEVFKVFDELLPRFLAFFGDYAYFFKNLRALLVTTTVSTFVGAAVDLPSFCFLETLPVFSVFSLTYLGFAAFFLGLVDLDRLFYFSPPLRVDPFWPRL